MDGNFAMPQTALPSPPDSHIPSRSGSSSSDDLCLNDEDTDLLLQLHARTFDTFALPAFFYPSRFGCGRELHHRQLLRAAVTLSRPFLPNDEMHRHLRLALQDPRFCDLALDGSDTSLPTLQTCILLTLHRLLEGGTRAAASCIDICISMAHRLGLHLISEDRSPCQEKKRRIWWTVWQLDLHRCIMEGGNVTTMFPATHLPSESWTSLSSPALEKDLSRRWKVLMDQDAPPLVWALAAASLLYEGRQVTSPEYSLQVQSLELAVGCFEAALPPNLQLHRSTDHTTLIIHLYIQGTKLLLYRSFASSGGSLGFLRNMVAGIPDAVDAAGPLPPYRAWSQFLAASDEIVYLIRQFPRQFRHLPLLSYIAWAAAVVQVVVSSFSPDPQQRSIADAKVNLVGFFIARSDEAMARRLREFHSLLLDFCTTCLPTKWDGEIQDITCDLFSCDQTTPFFERLS